MNTFNSSLFGEVSQPNTMKELLDIIVEVSSVLSKSNNVLMWRGQADISWAIHSGAYRRLALQDEEVTEQRMRFYEKNLLSQATHRGYRFFKGHMLTDLELLARLQHHGAATRLVDGTRNVMVALWFAVSSNENKVGMLLGLNSSYLGGYEGSVEERSYDNIIRQTEV